MGYCYRPLYTTSTGLISSIIIIHKNVIRTYRTYNIFMYYNYITFLSSLLNIIIGNGTVRYVRTVPYIRYTYGTYNIFMYYNYITFLSSLLNIIIGNRVFILKSISFLVRNLL